MRKKRKYKSTINSINGEILNPSKSIPISQTIKFKGNQFDSYSQKKRLQNQIWKSEEQLLEKKMIVNPISTSFGWEIPLQKEVTKEGLYSGPFSIKEKGRGIDNILSEYNPFVKPSLTSTEMVPIHPSEVQRMSTNLLNLSPKKDLPLQSQECLKIKEVSNSLFKKESPFLSEKVSLFLTKKEPFFTQKGQSNPPSIEKKQKLPVLSSLSFLKKQEGGDKKDKDFKKKVSLQSFVSEHSVLYPLSSEILALNRNKKRVPTSTFYLGRKEETKLSLIYGELGRKRLLRLGRQAQRGNGLFREKFIHLLESRLDVVVWRLCFWFSLYEIREWIRHRRIRVNNQPVTLSSLQLVAGDIVSLDPSWCQKVQKRTIRLFSLLSAGKGMNKVKRSFDISLYNKGEVRKDVNKLLPTTNFDIPDFKSYALFHQLYRWKTLSSLPSILGGDTVNKSASNRDVKTNKNYFYPTRKVSNWIFHSLTGLTLDLQKILPKISHLKGDPLFPIRVIPLISNDGSKDSDRNQRGLIKDVRKKVANTSCSTRNMLQPPFSRFSMMKCTHLEISYKTLSAVFLYPPQKVSLPAPIDFDLVYRSLG